nr:uncharacterized protein LOC113704959 isoform X3 [Coffea arabica]
MNRLHLVGKRTTWLPVVFVRMSKGRNYLSLTSARNAEMKAMIWLYLRFVKTNEGGKSIVNVTQESSSRWFIPFHRGISSLDHHSFCCYSFLRGWPSLYEQLLLLFGSTVFNFFVQAVPYSLSSR